MGAPTHRAESSQVSEGSAHRVSGVISTGIQTSKVKSPFPAALLWTVILGASPLPGRTLGAPSEALNRGALSRFGVPGWEMCLTS